MIGGGGRRRPVALAALFVASGFVAAGCATRPAPDPFKGLTAQATVHVPGMTAGAVVLRDRHGIAHVFCRADLDCIRAEGYVMAHDRLFEMDLYRHVAEGRLGAMVPAGFVRGRDRYYRRMLTGRDGTWVVDAIARSLSDPDRAFLQAFADGVNAYIAAETKGSAPLSDEYGFGILDPGVSPPAPWTVKDSIAIGRFFTLQLSSTYDQELQLASWASKLDPKTFGDLVRSAPVDPTFVLPGFYGGGAPLGRPFDPTRAVRRMHALAPFIDAVAARARRDRTLRQEPLGPSPGSNDWIVSAGLSSTGGPLVADDPHLNLFTPSLWWSVHLDAVSLPGAKGTLEAKGNTFPGVPGIVIGATRHVAWAVTNAGYDVTDLYLEKVTGVDTVLFDGKDVKVRHVLVKMANGPGPNDYDTEKICVVPEHGPLFAAAGESDADLADPKKPCVDPAKGSTALSVRWTGQDPSNELATFRGLLVARNVREAKAAIAHFEVGAQNFVVGDEAGHVLYDPHARVPIRGGDLTANPPWLPMPGTGGSEWKGDIPDADLPQALDPPRGFLVTANNDIVGTTADGNPLDGRYYLYFSKAIGLRAGRITRLLEATLNARGRVTPADMKRIQGDTLDTFARLMVPWLLQAAVDDPGEVSRLGVGDDVARLEAWDFATPTGLAGSDPKTSPPAADASVRDDAVATSIFADWYLHAVDDTVGDELRAAGIVPAGEMVPPSERLDRAFYFILVDHLDRYFDDVSTPNLVETRDGILLKALKEAVADLSKRLGTDPSGWLWGRLHVTDLPSPFGALGAGDPYAGPSVANDGGLYTVDVSTYGLGFHSDLGPSMRIVSDLDPAGVRAWQVIPGGEIDLMRSPNRVDQVPLWLADRYLEVPFTLEGAVSAARAREAAGLPARLPFAPAP